MSAPDPHSPSAAKERAISAPLQHRWVKAPRSLLAAYVCAFCGRDSMVKFYGECDRGR